VIAPQLPTPEGQDLESWREAFKGYMPLGHDSILIGHSCGAVFILRLLEQIDTRIRAAFLVAGPVKPMGNEFDSLTNSFVDKPFDWDRIRHNAGHICPIYSTDDPYVSLEHGEIAAANLKTELIVVQGAGHFNQKAGYLKFPLLLEKVREEL